MDSFIIAVCFAAVLGIGFYHSRRKTTTMDYFLAGRHVGWFAVGATLFSTSATSTSSGWRVRGLPAALLSAATSGLG